MDNTAAAHRPSADHFRISPTAKLVSYSRQFSDIPFAKEIAAIIDAEAITRSFFSSSELPMDDFRTFAPYLEIRYKGLISAIKRSGIKQVLELASGLSFRGPVMATDPELTYVETDLPGIMEDKLRVLEEIPEMRAMIERGNVFFEPLNVLDATQWEAAVQHFDATKPIAIVNEGLFMYLPIPEKEMAARQIHRVLEQFGGVWITPDLGNRADSAKRWRTEGQGLKFTNAIARATGRNFAETMFETRDQMEEFFHKIGFNVAESSQLDGSFDVSALDRLQLPAEYLDGARSVLKQWTLTLRR